MRDVAFQKLLASVILDNKYDRFVKNRKTGRLDTNSVYKINHSNKLFKKREARKNKDYSVSLLVDASGSMRGSRIELAAKSAAKLSHHLCKMGIPNNVVVFNLGVFEAKTFGIKEDKNLEHKIVDTCGGDTSRFYFYGQEATVVNVNYPRRDKMHPFLEEVVGWDEFQKRRDWYLTERGFRPIVQSGGNGNSDAEAIKIGRELLLKQKGSKIMIHLSDGQPAPMDKYLESPIYAETSQEDYDLKHEADITIASGIEMYAIGVQSSSVENYYPKKRTKIIKNLDDLYPTIIGLIKKNLRRG
jgi:cobalamin biosynthesis protein CobT